MTSQPRRESAGRPRQLLPRVVTARRSASAVGSSLPIDIRLTGLRGLAVLWVVLYHADQQFLPGHWYPVLSTGFLGVPLFLMLSVSLLLRSLDRKPDLARYFKRRVRRIWPLYFISLGLVFVFLDPSHSWLTLLENVLFVGVWVHGLGTGLGYVFWTVQLEELAYVTYPWLHALSLTGKRLVAGALILSSVSALWLDATAYLFLPLALGSFGWGILIYTGDVRRFGGPLLWGLVITGVWLPDSAIGWGLGSAVLPGMAWAVAKPPKPTQWPWVVAIGEMSYSIYLMHKLLIVRMGWWGLPMTAVAALVMEGDRLRRSLTLRAEPGTVADTIVRAIRRCAGWDPRLRAHSAPPLPAVALPSDGQVAARAPRSGPRAPSSSAPTADLRSSG